MGDHGGTPPPSYSAVISGDSLEMKGTNEGEKGKDGTGELKKEEEDPLVPPPVGLFELVRLRAFINL